MKINISTTIERTDFERLEKIVAADQSHMGLIVRKAIVRGLPLVEQDVLGTDFAGKNVPRSKRAKSLAA